MTTAKVLVTSDTHVSVAAKLPTALLQLADKSDHIIHAGDHISLDVVDTLGALAPITAVHGNVDDMLTRLKLPARAEVELGGVAIGVVHDPGPARGRLERLSGWFPQCAVLVYGHTHAPVLEHVNGPTGSAAQLIINPGSPTQRRRAPTHTACWLELRDGAIVAADLVHLDE